MKLEGIHHVTAITGDAVANVGFYVRVLGLRMVKKTVNFDAPDVYHLYYGDELGHPGSAMTFFEFPGAPRGRAGAGMVHRVTWRVRDAAALDFWAGRLEGEGLSVQRGETTLGFADPEGLALELTIADVPDEPLAATAPDVYPEHALLGFDGVRAFSARPDASRPLLEETLGFARVGDDAWEVVGDARRSRYSFDAAPAARGRPGGGTVHHVAWACADADHEAWHERALEAGAHVTPIIDREYFKSIYFREPSGVLFEIATPSPGFTVDEPAETLGQELKLPRQHEHLRERLERTLTPLPDPRDVSI